MSGSAPTVVVVPAKKRNSISWLEAQKDKMNPHLHYWRWKPRKGKRHGVWTCFQCGRSFSPKHPEFGFVIVSKAKRVPTLEEMVEAGVYPECSAEQIKKVMDS